MAKRSDAAFVPKKLDPDDLRAPVTASLRRLPPAMRDEIHGARVRLVRRVHPFGPTRRLGRKRAVLAGALGIPFVCLFLSPLPAAGLAWMLVLGAAYALGLYELEPPPLVCGLVLVGLVALAHALTGTPLLIPPDGSGLGSGLYFLFAICRLTILLCLGMILGTQREQADA